MHKNKKTKRYKLRQMFLHNFPQPHKMSLRVMDFNQDLEERPVSSSPAASPTTMKSGASSSSSSSSKLEDPIVMNGGSGNLLLSRQRSAYFEPRSRNRGCMQLQDLGRRQSSYNVYTGTPNLVSSGAQDFRDVASDFGPARRLRAFSETMGGGGGGVLCIDHPHLSPTKISDTDDDENPATPKSLSKRTSDMLGLQIPNVSPCSSSSRQASKTSMGGSLPANPKFRDLLKDQDSYDVLEAQFEITTVKFQDDVTLQGNVCLSLYVGSQVCWTYYFHTNFIKPGTPQGPT